MILTTNWFNHPRNDLYCVEGDVKQANNQPCIGCIMLSMIYLPRGVDGFVPPISILSRLQIS